nr:sensor histidine kinase [Tuberibacillus sp. Marseille-P3662]
MMIISLTVIFAYMESKQIKEQKAQLALQTAKTVSLIPAVEQALRTNHPSDVIQPIVNHVQDEVGAAFIIIGNREGVRYSFTDTQEMSKSIKSGGYNRAIVFGANYNSTGPSPLGSSLKGTSPIYRQVGDAKKLVGVVTVGFLTKDIQQEIWTKMTTIGLFALVVLLFGIVGGVFLTKNIRKDTLGLEPHEIAALYRERGAILQSVKEGVVAVDEKGLITMINASACDTIGVEGDLSGKSIKQVIPNTRLYSVLENGTVDRNQEMILNDRVVIANRVPIIEKGRVVGAVSSFRDKTELRDMVNTLSEVKKYSEDLRAQTHEFKNKLYVLSGMLQLGHYQEAIDMIQVEAASQENQSQVIFNQIHDPNVQAILLGKISQASEKKIHFTIDRHSSLDVLPEHFDISKIITILGNLIDNAFEAVMVQEDRQVAFFTWDVGNDVVFEVADNGKGIPEHHISKIFRQGYSSKASDNRGYGLANVKEALDSLGGTIEVDNQQTGGAIFSVFIPINKNS